VLPLHSAQYDKWLIVGGERIRLNEWLHRRIGEWEADSSLLEPNRLRERIEVLDELDALFGDADARGAAAGTDLSLRVGVLRGRLEAVNASIYEEIRGEVQQGERPDALRRWMEICRDRAGTAPAGLEPDRLGYDCLDELISGVLGLREPGSAPDLPGPEEVFYQPTPVRHILHLIAVSGLSERDVLIDLGSGLGHVPLLASILTGARCMGIEAKAAYVACARECADCLGLSRVSFVCQDAREADLSAGTVFYLYTPFTGGLLRKVLGRLEKESAKRAIRVCTFGPCTVEVAREPWLHLVGETPETDRIGCFWGA
jgi:hypothetical protein